MIRSNTDWYTANRDDANPIFEDELRPREYSSSVAKGIFCAFSYFCMVILYGVLAFATGFIVLSLYGFAHYNLFEDMMSNCLSEDRAKARTFSRHHVYRLAFQMAYGLSAVAFCLIATRVARFNSATKVCLTILAFLISIVCVAGDVQEIAWPLPLVTLPDCEHDWYVTWLYRSWPMYTFNLLIFIVFLAVKRLEKSFLVRTDSDV